MKKLLEVMTSQSTKAEEIDTLDKMVEVAGEQTYLSSFFSPEMVGWVKNHIIDDFSCNYYEQLAGQESITRKLDIANSAYELASKERNELKVKNDELVKQYAMLLSEEAEVERKVDFLENYKEELIERSDDYRKSFEETLAERNGLSNQVNTLNSQLDIAVQQIIELKAKLYDLTCGK